MLGLFFYLSLYLSTFALALSPLALTFSRLCLSLKAALAFQPRNRAARRERGSLGEK